MKAYKYLYFLCCIMGAAPLLGDSLACSSTPECLCVDEEAFDSLPDFGCNTCCEYGYFKEGVWLPEAPPLFKPLVADPRQICYSAGWRLNDEVLVKNVIDVSYGDSIPFYRWCDVGPFHGQLQIELQGSLWAVFDPLHESSPLMNADYYGGLAVTYACGPWSYRLRGYHISSHIGDEFLLNHPHFHRKNPSAEYLDFYVSNYLSDDIRLYGGIGVILHQDESFRTGRMYYQAGAEFHMSEFGFYNPRRQFYGRPYFAMDFRYQTVQNHHVNQTYVLGYEWGNTYCMQHVFRIFLEYHSGYSYEGQFARCPTTYFSIRTSYSY